jgi:exodeoxyribonuclease III
MRAAMPETLKIASWNINSVRLRIGLVGRFVDSHGPDILCLQEIKCETGLFPAQALADMGLPHLVVRGQKGWHGVAIASRVPLEDIEPPDFCRHGEARVAAARIGGAGGIEVHNLYVPAGGDVPDRAANPKFDHKLDFLARMDACYAGCDTARTIVTGDLNIAPGEHDVWSHKDLLDVVSHTPVETAALEGIRTRGRFADLARVAVAPPARLYSWWSYRSADWTKNDRGRRLDHIWAGEALAPGFDPASFEILRDARSWDKPSDHVPVMARITI